MKNIDTILEEFNLEGKITEQHAEDIRYILRTAFAEYKRELREAVGEMRGDIGMRPHFPGGQTELKKCWQIEALDSVLELLK